MIRLARSDYIITLQVIPFQPQKTHSVGDLFNSVCACVQWTPV
jgi:hypothetical protein